MVPFISTFILSAASEKPSNGSLIIKLETTALPLTREPDVTETRNYILTLTCTDRPGIMHSVSGSILENGGKITGLHQFDDPETGLSFLRIVFATDSMVEQLNAGIAALANEGAINWCLCPADRRARVLLLVSKFDHCLVDLLYRHGTGELNMDVVGIVSNHPLHMLKVRIAENIPLHYLPITKETKLAQETHIKAIVEDTGAELIVLARYMQILSDDLAMFLSGRCINIHHSFLPSFKGAKPYHQAHARGVKMIGATAHYVTADLDEGPIIHQDVERVNHTNTPDDLVRKGRDIERRVLAEAVRLHLEHRVLVNGMKTIVFRM